MSRSLIAALVLVSISSVAFGGTKFTTSFGADTPSRDNKPQQMEEQEFKKSKKKRVSFSSQFD